MTELNINLLDMYNESIEKAETLLDKINLAIEDNDLSNLKIQLIETERLKAVYSGINGEKYSAVSFENFSTSPFKNVKIATEGLVDMIKQAGAKIKEWIMKFIKWLRSVFDKSQVQQAINNSMASVNKLKEWLNGQNLKQSVSEAEALEYIKNYSGDKGGVSIPYYMVAMNRNEEIIRSAERTVKHLESESGNLLKLLEEIKVGMTNSKTDDELVQDINNIIRKSDGIAKVMTNILMSDVYKNLSNVTETMFKKNEQWYRETEKEDGDKQSATSTVVGFVPNTCTVFHFGIKNLQQAFPTAHTKQFQVNDDMINDSFKREAIKYFTNIEKVKNLAMTLTNNGAVATQVLPEFSERVSKVLEKFMSVTEVDDKNMTPIAAKWNRHNQKLSSEMVKTLCTLTKNTLGTLQACYSPANVKSFCNFIAHSYGNEQKASNENFGQRVLDDEPSVSTEKNKEIKVINLTKPYTKLTFGRI